MEEQVQSEILSEEQVQDIVEDKQPEAVEEQQLPSETPEEGLLAGKYKSPEDLEKAYLELQSKLGQPKEKEAKVEEPNSAEVDEEYLEYKRNKEQQELLKDVGGVDTYNQALEWARDNLSENEIKEYNKALEEVNGNKAATKLLAKSLIQQFQAKSRPSTDPIHSGETAKTVVQKGYATKSDMMKDMNDPRYEKDEGYRQLVAQKLAATDESKWYANIPRY